MTENKGKETASGLHTLRVQADISRSATRVQTLEGVEYIVVPAVILVEGVHHGSGGPILYNAEELSKFTPAWNTKPVVLYHPERDGQALSATEPAVLESAKVGMLMNTEFRDGKLRSEVWIDKRKADKVDNRILDFVRRGEVMELSTGIYFDIDFEDGEWNGKSYQGIARNFRPDHLALLPDQLGACSINDGCGLMRNKDGGESMTSKIKTLIGELAILAGIKADTDNFKAKVTHGADGSVHYGNLHPSTLTENLTGAESADEGAIPKSKQKESNTMNETKEPAESNQTPAENKQPAENTPVKNCECPNQNQETATPKVETPPVNKAETKEGTTTVNIQVKGGEAKMTLNEWREYSRKCELVANITAQENNEFTDAELSEMTLNQLEKINKFVPEKQEPANVTPIGNYALQGRVDNSDPDMEPLPLPKYNYASAK